MTKKTKPQINRTRKTGRKLTAVEELTQYYYASLSGEALKLENSLEAQFGVVCWRVNFDCDE